MLLLVQKKSTTCKIIAKKFKKKICKLKRSIWKSDKNLSNASYNRKIDKTYKKKIKYRVRIK